jgi:hypothetical protein
LWAQGPQCSRLLGRGKMDLHRAKLSCLLPNCPVMARFVAELYTHTHTHNRRYCVGGVGGYIFSRGWNEVSEVHEVYVFTTSSPRPGLCVLPSREETLHLGQKGAYWIRFWSSSVLLSCLLIGIIWRIFQSYKSQIPPVETLI